MRLIDEDNNQVGIVATREALSRAREMSLDLVEVAPTSEPPVCRIMDYGKWQYQQKRKLREAHKKHPKHAISLKEIRLRPETDTHDLEVKQKHALQFLEKGHKVQFTVFFRGRQMLHKEKGYDLLNRISEDFQEIAKVERVLSSLSLGREFSLNPYFARRKMAEKLYHVDSYLREFDAVVTAVSESWVTLDRTAFYPRGGGQPSDQGQIIRDGESFAVAQVKTQEGEIWHAVDPKGLREADEIVGKVNWQHRYELMRTHTAMHILCGVIWRDYGSVS